MDREIIAEKLKALLLGVIAEGEGGRVKSAVEIDPVARFSDLGINSVDLLEFILRLEQEFELRVLDDMLPEELPDTLAGWLEVVSRSMKAQAR